MGGVLDGGRPEKQSDVNQEEGDRPTPPPLPHGNGHEESLTSDQPLDVDVDEVVR